MKETWTFRIAVWGVGDQGSQGSMYKKAPVLETLFRGICRAFIRGQRTPNGQAKTEQLFRIVCIFTIRESFQTFFAPTMNRTDAQLVNAMQQGDSHAFEELYHRHKDAVFGYCFRMLHHRHTTEDAVQDTFIKVLNASNTLRDADAFLPWLYRIARNHVLMSLRARRTEALEAAETIPADEDPFDSAVANECSKSLQEHLERLRPEYREALLLREYQQLSYAEIALATDSTESAVKSRIFKARRALAVRLRASEL
jgi:RNA polymerase sigma-70 factor (ECF subfamily)